MLEEISDNTRNLLCGLMRWTSITRGETYVQKRVLRVEGGTRIGLDLKRKEMYNVWCV